MSCRGTIARGLCCLSGARKRGGKIEVLGETDEVVVVFCFGFCVGSARIHELD